jgi:hypothetical protein
MADIPSRTVTSLAAQAAVLLTAYPQWAVWLPADRAVWTAVRPAGSIPPGPQAPMVWVHAATADELEGLMRAADAQLPAAAADQVRRRG